MSFPSRIPAAAVSVLFVVAGCAAPQDIATDRPESALGHVHDLGVNPGDGLLYVASHNGVFRVKGSRAELIADRQQDTMGFTVVGPDTFLASGHPDEDEDLPPQLGLIESRDAARSWTPLSLEGQADFHALEVAEEWTYGYESATQTIMSTRDRETWEPLARGEFFDIAADPERPTVVMATTSTGEIVELSQDAGPRTLPIDLTFGLLDWTQNDELAAVGPQSDVYLSDDRGESWVEQGRLNGRVQAINASGDTWYAATSSGVFESSDQGTTWSRLVEEVA